MKQDTAFDPTHRPWTTTYDSVGIAPELPQPAHASLAELV